ncbi:PREDICTED: GATS-like protein 2 isoform X1 [Amphimedon queenslandica]|uniref:GATS-like protein 3 n=2 Tax=Amphimedon queenslandica TaxID=400682 RepID=A0AAN0J361_AMPQE|nr:PREDICTED: GATS-like protein 2 isoform X1 [Amphimedon queenslandica]|eukprot:XP_019851162.1 PREDICTED: GATS-like protein 2 isoform X1 [Amphimedon queenslandica]
MNFSPRRVSMSVRPALHLLPLELRIASIGKDDLPSFTYPLLQMTLGLLGQQSSCRQNHFFSFTETKNDYSLILDNELFKELIQFPGSEALQVAPESWRPLTIEVGAFGSLTGISKLVASVIGPLADEGVSVFCLSTNQEDYVMVKEKDLYKAMTCLHPCFKLLAELEQDVQLIENFSHDNVPNQIKNDLNYIELPSPRSITHPFTCTASKFHVCSILPSTLPSIAQPLLQLMFYNTRSDDVFLSLSIISDDISMVLDARDIDKFPEDSVYSSEAYWKVITIGDGPLGFDECGIVAQVAAPLAQADISTYYICTFYNDHTLVPEGSVTKALQLLNKYLMSSKVDNSSSPVSVGSLNGLTHPPSQFRTEPLPRLPLTNPVA